MAAMTRPASSDELSPQHDPFRTEAIFYSAYDWCLDPHLTVGEAIERLGGEIGRLPSAQAGWQLTELTTNMYLLSCSLLNGIDEYLRGHTLRLPARLAKTRPGRIALWVTEQVGETLAKRDRVSIRRWKAGWEDALEGFFAALARGETDPLLPAESSKKLSGMLQLQLPSDVLALRLGVPSAFSQLDMTHFDVLALGRQFVSQHPDRSLPILLLGLRTAGTYFSALLRPFFKTEGYQRVVSLTVQPTKGPGRRERNELRRYAKQGFTVLIVDDPPHTGGAIVLAVNIAGKAGFDLSRIEVLAPIHPAAQNWAVALPASMVVTLEPERWRKRQLLEPKNVENRLAEYFTQRGFSGIRVVSSRRADELNAELQNGSRRGTSLTRIFEVQLRSPQGPHETRFVRAKSVGLGYLGYPAFLAAQRLSDFVPPLLGLRDGILYTEWLPEQFNGKAFGSDRELRIDTAAAYIAARTRELSLPKLRLPGKAVRENGLELLAKSFGRAYGRLLIDIPMRSWILQQLNRLHCPFPTLIDGNMGQGWIDGKPGPLKAGYYGHGLGKAQLNAIDPAYDLAETILSLALSADEEDRLIRRYVEQSGDVEVGQRLFINKLLAGLWTMGSAQEHLFGARQTGQQQQELLHRFLGAWNFLTIQTARLCGARCRGSQLPRWRSPLVMLDVDGVIDRRMFGYPCTTAAGMEALSLLARGGYSVALNTARSAAEVRDYCEAYGMAGGVAEHGAYLWDAVAQRGQCLIGQETMAQLDELRWHLRRIPGVFLDERHQYSIRAFIFEKQPASLLSTIVNSARSFSVGLGMPTPLPTLLVSDLLTTLRLDRLSFHHTTIDTTVVAKDTDKGTGLTALRDRVLGPDAETIAIGDTEADLPMFRSATRSFAPAQISCRQQARLLGCSVSRYRYQRGLLDIVRKLANSESTGELAGWANEPNGVILFLDLLRASDRLSARTLIRALFDRTTFRIFIR